MSHLFFDWAEQKVRPFVLHEISVLIELPFGHLCYLVTDVPPQPNSPPDYVIDLDLGNSGQTIKNLPSK